MSKKLVIFGVSNILSDIFDCALAHGLSIGKIVIHLPEDSAGRNVPLARRLAALQAFGQHPVVETLDAFRPAADECYLLGPTTPTRAALADMLGRRHGLAFTVLVHPSAYVSPLAQLGQGVFVGAHSAIGPGAVLAEHVFVNRSVSIGHDTEIGTFSRIQPGSNLGGLSRIGRGVTVGIGATLIERLVLGDGVVVAAGAVVTGDVASATLVAGVPAVFKKHLPA